MDGLMKKKEDELLQTQKDLQESQSQIDDLKKAHQKEIDSFKQDHQTSSLFTVCKFKQNSFKIYIYRNGRKCKFGKAKG